MDWFRHAGLGVFIHWDHASRQGLELSWPLVGRWQWPGYDSPDPHSDDVTPLQYHSSADGFDPTEWDPVGLARRLRELGARYVVFTTRHHAGYSMFHTAYSDFGLPLSQTDLTRSLVEAARAEGLRIGLYYSLSDWHHPSYPPFTMADRPYRRTGLPRSSPAEWAGYRRYLLGQLTELLTDYGRIDLLWFDGEWERTAEEWGAAEIRELAKKLQPEILINDRLPGQGDYTTPEQVMPAAPLDGPWELCQTMSESWGHRPADTRYKSARRLAVQLSEVAARGGNLLLNISPTGTGALPSWQVDRLDELTAWTGRHGPALFGVAPSKIQFYGPVTESADTIYLHLVMRPVEQVVARGVPVKRVKAVRLLATGAELPFSTTVEVHDGVVVDDPAGELFVSYHGSSEALVDIIAVELGPIGSNTGSRPS